jgi:hypothetical protein
MGGGMKATIRIEDDDPTHALSLVRWLRLDESLSGVCTVELLKDDDTGHMGAGETIGLVLSQATAMASVAIAYASWRDSRPGKLRPKAVVDAPGVEIVFDRDDVRITVRNASAETVAVVVAAVMAAVRTDAAAG